MVKCKECGKEVSDKASTCVHCGAPVPKAPPKYSWAGLAWIAAAMLSGFILWIVIDAASTPDYVNEAYARQEMCEAFVKQGIAPLGTNCRILRDSAIAEGKRLAEAQRSK